MTQSFVYDNASRLKETAQYDGNSTGLLIWKRAQLTYKQEGLLDDIFRAQGNSGSPTTIFESNYDYDPAGRLNSIMHHDGTWTVDLYSEFTFDAADRITSMQSDTDGLIQFSYDTTNQLTGADWTSGTDETYSYDENGNRTMSGYDTDPNNQLVSDGTYNYTYDAEGNRATRTKISNGYVDEYVWDHRNRLESMIFKDDQDNILAVVENKYDYLNRWVQKTHDADGPGGSNASSTHFVYDGYQVVLQFDDSDASSSATSSHLSHLYFWTDAVDFLLADEVIDGSQSSLDVHWAAPDHIGTARNIVAYNSGTSSYVVNHRVFDSFGNLLSQTNATYASSIGFTGRMFETIMGLQFNLNRWYDAKVGRWISEDPIQFDAGDPSIVRYVNNSPVTVTDPDGLAPAYRPSFELATPDFPKSWKVHHTKQQAPIIKERYRQAGVDVDDLKNLRGIPQEIHDEINELQRLWWEQQALRYNNDVDMAKRLVPLEEIEAFEQVIDKQFRDKWITSGKGKLADVNRIIGYINDDSWMRRFRFGQGRRLVDVFKNVKNGTPFLAPGLVKILGSKDIEAVISTMEFDAATDLEFDQFMKHYLETIKQAVSPAGTSANMLHKLRNSAREFFTKFTIDEADACYRYIDKEFSKIIDIHFK